MHNLDDFVKTKDFYQLQLNYDKIIVKHVAHGDNAGDILVSKNFGFENKYSLYSCIYEKNEIEINKIIPLIYLTDGLRNYYISALLKSNEINIEHEQFELFFTHGLTKQSYFTIDKNIDKNNIFEKLFLILKNRGIDVLH